MAGRIKMPLGKEVGLGAGNIVLDGDPAFPPPNGHSPPIFGHVCCGQTAGWIKVPLGREVGLSPGHIVLDADPDPAPLPQRGTAPSVRPVFIVAKRSPISTTAEHLF